MRCLRSPSTASRSRFRRARPCSRRASLRARRSRASAITSGCRSPAIAGCAWSRSLPGPPKPQASCALPAADGQAIRTDTRDGQEGARGGDGVPAHQPPARLPDLRPGRRMRPAGPGDGLWPRLHPLRGEQARDRRQIYGPGHQDLDDPLHPVHALHPLLGRGRGRRRDRHALPRRGYRRSPPISSGR